MSHPWNGLSQDDLDTSIDCRALGQHHFMGPGRHAPCYCGLYYRGYDGKPWIMPDPSDYEDPPDPRDYL